MTEFVDIPQVGRTFQKTRVVALGDVNPLGRLRLDALARFVQDIATADAAEALSGSAYAYVLRRFACRVDKGAVLGERLLLTTFCGGTARGWAERRTRLVGDGGARIEVAALWVPISEAGRPVRLPDDFLAAYGVAAQGRRVEARLIHDRPGDDSASVPWPLRYVDLDTLNHVNNAAHWCAVENHLQGAGISAAEIEYVAPLLGADEADFLFKVPKDDRVDAWLCVKGHVRSSLRVWLSN